MCQVFGDECVGRGLRLPWPAETLILKEESGRSRVDVFLDRLNSAVEAICEFVLVLTPKEDKEIHCKLPRFSLSFIFSLQPF